MTVGKLGRSVYHEYDGERLYARETVCTRCGVVFIWWSTRPSGRHRKYCGICDPIVKRQQGRDQQKRHRERNRKESG